jgi:hypothetical protein
MARLFLDSLNNVVPRWLSNRWESAQQTAFKYLFAMVAPLDAMLDAAIQAGNASWPGYGDSSGLPLTGRARLVTRGMGETDVSYATRQLAWRKRGRIYGSQEAIARELHEFCLGNPAVRVVARSGVSTLVDAGGNLTRSTISWNWDGNSNPERAGRWSDMWIIIYAAPWGKQGPTWKTMGASWGSITTGIGQLCPRQDVDTVKALIMKSKACRSRVDAVIWCYDPTLFNPAVPSTMPDGWWGQWSKPDPANWGHRIRSRSTSTRVWEPHRSDLSA